MLLACKLEVLLDQCFWVKRVTYTHRTSLKLGFFLRTGIQEIMFFLCVVITFCISINLVTYLCKVFLYKIKIQSNVSCNVASLLRKRTSNNISNNTLLTYETRTYSSQILIQCTFLGPRGKFRGKTERKILTMSMVTWILVLSTWPNMWLKNLGECDEY